MLDGIGRMAGVCGRKEVITIPHDIYAQLGLMHRGAAGVYVKKTSHVQTIRRRSSQARETLGRSEMNTANRRNLVRYSLSFRGQVS
jgi:hypothetical protein